jgi:hypothetical protein
VVLADEIVLTASSPRPTRYAFRCLLCRPVLKRALRGGHRAAAAAQRRPDRAVTGADGDPGEGKPGSEPPLCYSEAASLFASHGPTSHEHVDHE